MRATAATWVQRRGWAAHTSVTMAKWVAVSKAWSSTRCRRLAVSRAPRPVMGAARASSCMHAAGSASGSRALDREGVGGVGRGGGGGGEGRDLERDGEVNVGVEVPVVDEQRHDAQLGRPPLVRVQPHCPPLAVASHHVASAATATLYRPRGSRACQRARAAAARCASGARTGQGWLPEGGLQGRRGEEREGGRERRGDRGRSWRCGRQTRAR